MELDYSVQVSPRDTTYCFTFMSVSAKTESMPPGNILLRKDREHLKGEKKDVD